MHKIALSASRAWTKDVEMSEKRLVKKHRWYLGGFASAGAAVFTHPLDLMKVSRPECMQFCRPVVYVLLSDVYSPCSRNALPDVQQWCNELA